MSFKYWLTVEAWYKASQRSLPRDFWASASFRREHPWRDHWALASFKNEHERQRQRIKDMTFRVVEINDPKVAAVFEVYASTILRTINSWETH